MDIIDLKSREVFGNDGRGIAALVEEPHLTIRQLGLEPGKSVPVHTTDAPVTIQVVRGEGVFIENGESFRIGPGKLLRIARGVSMGIANDSDEPLVILAIRTPLPEEAPRDTALGGKAGAYVNFVDFAPVKPGKQEVFLDWFRRSSEVFARHRGFISRTLLAPDRRGKPLCGDHRARIEGNLPGHAPERRPRAALPGGGAPGPRRLDAPLLRTAHLVPE